MKLALLITCIILWSILLLSLVIGFGLPDQPAWFVAGAVAFACSFLPIP